ncbi:calcium-binding protein [Methylobacterium isbiliense]|uniref:Calcium-binding protein n=1 Tax=Methylobacterium isbiliense TaxID=315478 RepID=A0ABQ4S7K8_9HYPH|nr:calcium-binding protein [Methylobacterium isbiliense]MDN3623449.1 calcium-binding protein [Methylobacterium isbiliense]GJD99171.1 hypothetical protein GMJLKIPL_1087 [Methylobacterium isbiliense]
MATIYGDRNWFFKDDTLMGGEDDDVIYGGDGKDKIHGGNGQDTLFGGNGDDTLSGWGGRDVLDGGYGNDSMAGGVGADTFTDIAGVDTMNGGDGDDHVDYSGYAGRVIVDLVQGTARQEYRVKEVNAPERFDGQGTDTLISIEDVSGGDYGDTIRGDDNGNGLSGGYGNDLLDGRGGNDVLAGGAGDDTLTGGSGVDTFLFDSSLAHAGIDRITDFNAAEDRFRLDRSIFTSLDLGVLDASQFKIVDTAAPTGLDVDDRIIVSSWNGYVYYDADGSGSGGAVAIADLDVADMAGISAQDFVAL